MKRTILALNLFLACAMLVYAQKAETQATGDASNQTSAALSQPNKSINLESGTRLAAELQNSIDVRKAEVGDQVILKTTQAIKSQGRTIVGTGARLVGRVTEVARKKGNGESRVGILFDRLERGSLAIPVTATISSITTGRASASAHNDDLFGSNTSAGGSARATSSAGSSSSSGGLLGGVGSVANSTTSTVGTAVGATTSAVGSSVDSTTNVVRNTATGVGHSLGRIQISESSNTSVEGGTVLSLQGDNLRLEKGTRFNLVLTQSASAGPAKDQ
jgi:hypothetical protein